VHGEHEVRRDAKAMVPGRPIEQLLKRAARRTVEVGDGRNALAFQIGNLTFARTGEVAARLGPYEAEKGVIASKREREG